MELVEFIVSAAVCAIAFGIWELGFRRDQNKKKDE